MRYRITEISREDTWPSARVGDTFETSLDPFTHGDFTCYIDPGFFYVSSRLVQTTDEVCGTWCKFEAVDPTPVTTPLECAPTPKRKRRSHVAIPRSRSHVADPTPTCVGPSPAASCKPLDELTHAERKDRPIFRGVFEYFPKACRKVAAIQVTTHFDQTDTDALAGILLDAQLKGEHAAVARLSLILLQQVVTGEPSPTFSYGAPGEPAGKAYDEKPDLYGNLLIPFVDALGEIAHLSKVGNTQHNPGQPMHWAREKSTDHGDCIVRHLAQYSKRDKDGVLHATKVAWRALAQLELAIEAGLA